MPFTARSNVDEECIHVFVCGVLWYERTCGFDSAYLIHAIFLWSLRQSQFIHFLLISAEQ